MKSSRRENRQVSNTHTRVCRKNFKCESYCFFRSGELAKLFGGRVASRASQKSAKVIKSFSFAF